MVCTTVIIKTLEPVAKEPNMWAYRRSSAVYRYLGDWAVATSTPAALLPSAPWARCRVSLLHRASTHYARTRAEAHIPYPRRRCRRRARICGVPERTREMRWVLCPRHQPASTVIYAERPVWHRTGLIHDLWPYWPLLRLDSQEHVKRWPDTRKGGPRVPVLISPQPQAVILDYLHHGST
ncbi:hypothetical protein GY45DRAFT_1330273 [Cubamyces sp. BRFM 1775]|nr:hypothetical protein GY45DRAFT_1330273 [Cubamyces sp. BRFM 1775]